MMASSGSTRWLARIGVALGVVLAGLFAHCGEAADGGDSPPDPAQVLDRFVGEWQTTIRLASEDADGPIVERKGRATCRRTLGDRYVEFRSESIPPGNSELQIMTYDVASGRYRQWVFDSDGYQHEADGTWNAATSTLTWRGERAGTAFVIEDRWVTPDRLEWTLTRIDPDGRRHEAVSGVLVRTLQRLPPAPPPAGNGDL
jgi:hypothetical protein